ncbi:trimeric intracellular cation channel family protein [Gilvibacter sp.]|uniref:trimeric intracellular cation channel family protein n=1 Tax=Gilvibacter sp. TaxID=2729997 RepID=UPI0035BE9F11
MSLLLWVDLLGTVAFAISGVLTAMKKGLDPFGIFIIAFVTSVGGGTVRDLLMDAPVFWMYDLMYIYTIAGAAVFAIIFRSRLSYLRRSLFLFDTIGIALYTLVGIQKGIAADFHPIICIILGTLSASFGGVIRDILCNEIPIIFRKEIYATACIAGGVVFFASEYGNFPAWLQFSLAAGVIITVRLIAVVFKLTLPSFYPQGKQH